MRSVKEFRLPEFDDVTTPDTPYLAKLDFILEKERPFRDVSFDELGRLSIDNNVLDVMNAASSRHGKLLKFFEQNRSRLIEIDELNKLLGRGLYIQTFKDAKKNLGQLGYAIRYFKQRNGGYIYYGIDLK